MSESRFLTEAERRRFSDWLDMEADSDEQMAAHMERLGSQPMLAVAKLHRTNAAALRLVSKRIRSTEAFTVSAKGNE